MGSVRESWEPEAKSSSSYSVGNAKDHSPPAPPPWPSDIRERGALSPSPSSTAVSLSVLTSCAHGQEIC